VPRLAAALLDARQIGLLDVALLGQVSLPQSSLLAQLAYNLPNLASHRVVP
jgi:hypothetical protein